MFPETGYLQPHVPAERRLASVWKWQEFKEGMEIKWRQTRHILDSQWRTFRDREEMRRKEWEGEREDWKAYRQELELRWIEVVAGWEGFVEAEEHRFKAWAEEWEKWERHKKEIEKQWEEFRLLEFQLRAEWEAEKERARKEWASWQTEQRGWNSIWMLFGASVVLVIGLGLLSLALKW